MNRQRAHFNHTVKISLILSLILSYNSSSFSQPDGIGKISGYVFNASHQPLANVEVRAIAASGTYFHRISYSAEDGSYVIDELPVGQYNIRVLNKLGYLNEFYDNVVDKSLAAAIKINANQHIENINFYLDRGGFISGNIYNSEGSKFLTNTSIGFFDAEDYNSYGFINGNSDGSYISPALPNRPHIVKASSLPSGYVITYFDNVSTQDSAQAIYVTPSDTVKDINFFLQKGGAISGYVYGENPGNAPIPDAWIVVSNWENGEWSSESRTDVTGYYCAAGLRPGAYRVNVYGIDPSKYHNEYYQDSPQYENASKVSVINQDTTRQINFSLKPVKRLTLANDYIELAVSDRYPGSNLTLGITGGLPDTHYDDNKPILFGHPYPYTSVTTIWIDGKELIYGSNDGMLVDDPYISHDSKSIGRRWDYQNIAVRQKITLVTSEWSETKYEDTAQIQYVIANNDNLSHIIGVRILLDTMLGQDDAMPIRTSNYAYTPFEHDFYSPNIPSWWRATVHEGNKIFFSVQGTLRNDRATLPDRFSIVNWSNIFKTTWNYKTNPDLEVINDSGVALWWEPVTVEPGNVRIISTFVGLGELEPDKQPPYTANHIPAKDSTDVPRNTDIQLDILDDYMGVDTTSITMKVNGEKVSPRISGTLQHFTLTHNPPNDFQYNDTVRVEVEALDLAIKPNIMTPDSYQFYIERDTLPPFVKHIYPSPTAHNVKPDTSLSFLLGDEHSGVNSDSIQIYINGQPISPQLDGSPQEYSVRYLFRPPFDERDSVSVRIFATDLVTPSNEVDTTCYFFVARDSIAPQVKSYFPKNNAIEVDLDTTIFIELVDDFTGVDYNSIRLSLNDKLVTPQIEGDSSRYFITYRPNNGFLYNEQKMVSLEAHDMAKLTNVMTPFVFGFDTEIDTMPPLIALLTPSQDDTNVNPTPLITVEIKDEKAGVDSSSIVLQINGENIQHGITGDDTLFIVNYQCETSFDYLEWISVTVFAKDKSNPPNASDSSVFRFRIMREKDLSPPYTSLHQPQKGAAGVHPNSSISFHINDDLSGVDSSSIRLQVNGIEVNRKISGNVHDYKFEYKPPQPFDFGQQVLLEIDAQDLAKDAPNVMDTDSVIFTIMFDTSAPQIVWIEPGQPGEHIPLESEFIADIIDTLTGLDASSLKFKFQGEVIYPQVDCFQHNCRIRYVPTNPLKYNQRIEFIITGSDRAIPPNWIQDDSLSIFYTIEDHDPPYVTLRIPDKDEPGVDFKPEINVCIKDDIAGVDRDSVRIILAGQTVTPTFSGTPHEMKLSYTHTPGFPSEKEVIVTIEAADLSNPPNQMDRDSYRFFIKNVYPDLFIQSMTVNQSKIMVHKPIQFNAIIAVDTAPVFDSIEVKVSDHDFVLADKLLGPMDINESHSLARTFMFKQKGKHPVKLEIDPGNKIKESNEDNNTAIVVIEVNEGELVVRPNPFTPNGDGINDEVSFNFEKLGVLDPRLKLFDVSGRMIATINERRGYKFVWDGRDRFGNPAQPGVFLYLIQDQDKTIANGYVVLAR